MGSLKEAYAILIANTDIENDASVTGAIVICGKIETSENFNFENDGSCTHKGTVTLTSKYNNVDYRESGAQLHLASAHTGTSSTHGTACEQRFQVGGPTIMENLTINRAGSKQPLTIYAGTYLYIDETVQTLNTNYTYTPPTPAISGLTDAQIATIELSAHRGYQPMGPENSILSFQAAANLGFTYIETDVYRTTDGELICIHDSTLDRTTNATGNVTQMTLAQVQAAKIDTAGYGYDITTADPSMLYVPTFREYLEICKAGGCKPFIELKDTRNDVTEEIIDMALECFDAEDIVISSGYGNLLVYAHQYNPDVFIHKIWISGAGTRVRDLQETGLLEELLLENMYRNPKRNFSIWDSILYEKVRFEENIDLILNCACCDVEMDGNKVVSVDGFQLTTYTWHTVSAKIFIDCSGDSILAPLTGAEYRVGREAKKGILSHYKKRGDFPHYKKDTYIAQ